MKNLYHKTLTITSALFLVNQSAHAQGLDIVINPGADLLANPVALAAFERAAVQWESIFTDPIIVTIDADLTPLASPTTLGQAGSVSLVGGFDLVRNTLVADSASETDDTIVSFLPTSTNFTADLPADFALSGNLSANKANLKAIGVTGLDALFGATDATITFNSSFTFDFDNTDGITPGQFDFEAVAAHEIGHALGFVSEVDTVDFLIAQTAGIGNAFETQAALDAAKQNISPALFDLFRFSDTINPSNTAEFSTFERALSPGGVSLFDEVIENFIPGSEALLSTGEFTGDGEQASHWQDTPGSGTSIGLLDPTLASGELGVITTADIRALDLIGYDVDLTVFSPVPEPSSVLLASLSLLFLGRRRR